MPALFVISAVVIMLALAAGAYRLAFWRGWEGSPRAGQLHHVTYSPGFELSAFEQALRAFSWWRRHHPGQHDPSQP